MRLNRYGGRTCLAALGLLSAAGCLLERDRSLEQEVSGRIASGDREITRLARSRAEAASGVRIAGRPWYGSDRSGRQAGSPPSAGAFAGEPLPGNLERRGGIALSIPTQTSLQEAAGLISRTAGIPLSINLRLPAGEGAAASADLAPSCPNSASRSAMTGLSRPCLTASPANTMCSGASTAAPSPSQPSTPAHGHCPRCPAPPT